ncbi:spore coat associated protein CotJA [Gottschalkia acidurici]|uniref:spore coat associated protein CotJA n=1 Tax=Clostridium acidurici TaxID=1556 RepID=UPI000314289C|nr:spore coat associated protein CotJA [Gottschalkia acidurici]
MYKDDCKKKPRYISPDCLKPNSRYKLAHAYVPFQTMDKVYCPEDALKRGTLFPELHLPYYIRQDGKKC